MPKNPNITAALLEKARKKIILPVDVSTYSEAEHLIKTLGPYVGIIKVGLETMTAIGGPVIAKLAADYGVPIFYDGKFNDIKNTVEKAAIALRMFTEIKAFTDIRMMNLHATSGDAAISAAVKQRGAIEVLVVTVLTSIGAEECEELFGGLPKDVVLKFARKALKNGAQGIVCSGEELEMLNEHQDVSGLLKVVPGIQPKWMPKNDQNRVMTPYEAIIAGADYLVIGRAITAPPKDYEPIQGDPLKAVALITEEIATAILELEAVGVK